MIQEVVQSIVQAEQAAEQMIASAKEKAKATILEAENQVEQMQTTHLLQLKDRQAILNRQMDEQANVAADTMLQQGKLQAQATVKGYALKKKKAVDFIVGSCKK